ncbi:MAG: hypothetical protein Q4D98_08415 [Planctomycetia bacterium]|nr:hypothetical protein [Planctomycetia bacterium]
MKYTIDATHVPYTRLNRQIRLTPGTYRLDNINGQRYLGCGLGADYHFQINGTPGNDLGAFMDGAEITVNGNCQDATGNTMNGGSIIVHGNASDTAGYAMRNGEIFIRGDAGYRVAIHMKQYGDEVPVLVVGGKTGSFLGEYMAGGIVLVLGLGLENPDDITGSYCATGMHGGTIYLRGDVPDYKIAYAMVKEKITVDDEAKIRPLLKKFTQNFGISTDGISMSQFVRIRPKTTRPYGKMYVGN